LYNPGEANSAALLERFHEACKELGLSPREGAAQSSAVLPSTTAALISKGSEAIYVPTDNTVVSAIDVVLKTALANKIPVFAAESDSVGKGAVAALAINYTKLGETTGHMLAQVLSGKAKPANLPVQRQ